MKGYLHETTDGGCSYWFYKRETINDGKVVLRRAKKGNWASPAAGELCVSMRDDGNGVDVRIPSVKDFRLDYCQAWELFLAFCEYYDDERQDKAYLGKLKRESEGRITTQRFFRKFRK